MMWAWGSSSNVLSSTTDQNLQLFVERSLLDAEVVLVRHIQTRLSRPKKGEYIEIGYIYDDETNEVSEHYIEQVGYSDKQLRITTSLEQVTTNGSKINLDVRNLKVVEKTNSRGEQVKELEQILRVERG